MRNVFKKDGERSGFTISETTKGFKIETWSVYSDEPNRTYYINYTDYFQPGFNGWQQAINEHGTTYADLLLRDIREGYIKPYRTITE
ncbi:MAG: hypothetical protein GX957_16430 [Clostridiaceae bacterium]|nr:hypothetical protein [Clostridiaceae bacterium]